jgi:hypothetical protein
MRTLNLKANHKKIAHYQASLDEFARLGIAHEGAVRAALQGLLEDCTALVNKGRTDKLKLVPEFWLKTKAGAKITPDGVLLDSFRLIHGVWEAKDTADDLDKEITKKFKLGYPRDNIFFQSPNRAVLVQDGGRVLDLDISKPDNLVEILRTFFEYQAPAFDKWEKAVGEFKDRLPEISMVPPFSEGHEGYGVPRPWSTRKAWKSKWLYGGLIGPGAPDANDERFASL